MRITGTNSSQLSFDAHHGSSYTKGSVLNNRKKNFRLDLAKVKAELKRTEADIDNIVTKYDMLLGIYRERINELEVQTPTELPEYRWLRRKFLAFEFIFYIAGFLLLFYQLTIYFADLDWWMTLLLALGIDITAAVLVYSTILIAAKIDAKVPNSVKPLKSLSIVSAVIIIAAFIAFSITRTSDGSNSWDVMIFNGALIASECSFIALGAAMSLYRDFVSWSRNHERLYKKRLKQFYEFQSDVEDLTAKLDAINEQLTENPSAESKEEGSENIH